jgi:uncharacterized protein YbaR (Trm112 family)
MVRGGILVKHAAFNTSLLQYLACPLSKDPLRYCEKSQELVNDSLGVAYPVCCASFRPLLPTQYPKKQERINHSSWGLGEHFYLGRIRQIRQGLLYLCISFWYSMCYSFPSIHQVKD